MVSTQTPLQSKPSTTMSREISLSDETIWDDGPAWDDDSFGDSTWIPCGRRRSLDFPRTGQKQHPLPLGGPVNTQTPSKSTRRSLELKVPCSKSHGAYLDDTSMDQNDLFTICTTMPPSHDQVSSLPQPMEQFGESCPEFGFSDFDLKQDASLAASCSHIDWDPRPEYHKSWALPDWSDHLSTSQWEDTEQPDTASTSKSEVHPAEKVSTLVIDNASPSLDESSQKTDTTPSVVARRNHSQFKDQNLQLPPAFALMARAVSRTKTEKNVSPHRPVQKSKRLGDIVKQQSNEPTRPKSSSQVDIRNHEPAWLMRLRWKKSRFHQAQPEDDTTVESEASWKEESTSLSLTDFPSNVAITDKSEETQGEALTWTRDPDQNYSDWTIVVVTGWTVSDTVETFYVHKNIMGLGPRASTHFQHLFQNSTESDNSSTLLELSQSEFQCFPVMLDYIYSFDMEPLEISTSNAHALRNLGDRFGVKHMVEEVDAFLSKETDMKEHGGKGASKVGLAERARQTISVLRGGGSY